jgi:Xaa-Pro aminopeptidase
MASLGPCAARMYEAVLDCHRELIRGIRPGVSSIGGLYTQMMVRRRRGGWPVDNG